MRTGRIGNTAEFIDAARLKHQNWYRYPHTHYVRSYIKVRIECPVHGDFNQRPDKHLLGQGCRKCGDEQRGRDQATRPEEFIVAATQKYDDQYDYSEVTKYYINRVTKVPIRCRKHRIRFWQEPGKHLYGNYGKGSGCKQCGIERGIAANSYDRKEFIRKANVVWEHRFTYPRTRFRGVRELVTVTCQLHGDFRQKARKHLEGVQGCSPCSKIERTDTYNRRYGAAFVAAAKKLKDNPTRYNYNDFIYSGSQVKGKIWCNFHGRFFEQTPSVHLQGKGCPDCCVRGKYNEDYFRGHPEAKTVPGVLYLMTFQFRADRFAKVGISRNGFKSRWSYKSHYRPYRIHHILTIHGPLYSVFRLEQRVRVEFARMIHRPQYGNVKGNSECFAFEALPLLAEYLAEVTQGKRKLSLVWEADDSACR